MLRSREWSAYALLIVLACRHGSGAEEAPAPHAGAYEVRAILGSARIDALMVLAPDTILFLARGHSCRPQSDVRDSGGLHYSCTDITGYEHVDIRIDRANPAGSSRWEAQKNGPTKKLVCIRYRTSPTGEQVCARYDEQYQDGTTTESGRLQVMRNVDHAPPEPDVGPGLTSR